MSDATNTGTDDVDALVSDMMDLNITIPSSTLSGPLLAIACTTSQNNPSQGRHRCEIIYPNQQISTGAATQALEWFVTGPSRDDGPAVGSKIMLLGQDARLLDSTQDETGHYLLPGIAYTLETADHLAWARVVRTGRRSAHPATCTSACDLRVLNEAARSYLHDNSGHDTLVPYEYRPDGKLNISELAGMAHKYLDEKSTRVAEMLGGRVTRSAGQV